MLTMLNLSNNKMLATPAGLFNHLPNLKYLSLGNNRLSSLDPAVSNLKQLETLDISDNRLENLPDSIYELPKLTMLNLAGNKLQKLPTLPAHLQQLNLEGNPFSRDSILALKKQFPQVDILFS